jgi:membrane protein YdbS with pleckstrin-like domain
MWLMDKKMVIQWIVTAVLRLAAGAVAYKFGKDAVNEQTWTAIGEGAIAALLAVVSIYTSVKARKNLLETPPPQ